MACLFYLFFMKFAFFLPECCFHPDSYFPKTILYFIIFHGMLQEKSSEKYQNLPFNMRQTSRKDLRIFRIVHRKHFPKQPAPSFLFMRNLLYLFSILYAIIFLLRLTYELDFPYSKIFLRILS